MASKILRVLCVELNYPTSKRFKFKNKIISFREFSNFALQILNSK